MMIITFKNDNDNDHDNENDNNYCEIYNGLKAIVNSKNI